MGATSWEISLKAWNLMVGNDTDPGAVPVRPW